MVFLGLSMNGSFKTVLPSTNCLIQSSMILMLPRVNQIGSVTESIDVVKMSKHVGWGVMTRHHRIDDLAVGLSTGQIKIGTPCRSEQLAKYNQFEQCIRVTDGGYKGVMMEKLKEHMQYCIDHPEEISMLEKVKAQVSEVKGVMMENIKKVLDLGETIELLVDKTENLRSQAHDFRKQGTNVRMKIWIQNMR